MKTLFACLVGCAAVAACGSDAEKPAAASRADLVTRMPPLVIGMVDESTGAMDLVSKSPSWDLLGDSLSVAIPDSTGMVTTPGPITAAQRFVRRLYIEHMLANTLDDMTAGERFSSFLLDDLFSQANYEGEGVWRMTGEKFCPETCTGPLGGMCTPNAECLRTISDLEIRVRVSLAPAGGLDFTLIIGPDRDEVLALELRPDSIKVSIDLAAVKGAVAHVARVLGEMPMLPRVLEGRGSFTLRLNGPRDVTFETAIEQAVRIEMDLQGRGALKVSLAAANPLAQVRIHDVDPLLSIKIAIGHTLVSGPFSQSGTMEIDLGGLGGEMQLGRNQESVQITGIGLGDATSELRLDGQRLIGVDINPNDGRRFSLGLSRQNMQPLISLDPTLDVAADMQLAALVAQGEDIPAYFSGETYRVTASGPPRLEPIAATAATAEALKVLMGRLTIASTAVQSPIVVDAGSCLLPDPVTTGEHPILGALASGPCP